MSYPLTKLVGGLLLLTAHLSAQQPAEPLGWSACGAYVAPGEWRSFMCYNLGAANTSADPFTPSWEINGGYWQWGRKEMAASGPSGPGEKESGAGEVAGWNSYYAPDSSWLEGRKTELDPCPVGFRVPGRMEWEGVLEHNTSKKVGSWENNATNYTSGRFFGRKLFLPAAGYRYYTYGALSYRGDYGVYWSSSENGSIKAWDLDFNSGYANTYDGNRSYGRSVRCIAE
jgi:uncharacterized protein (TIGR02145 family)